MSKFIKSRLKSFQYAFDGFRYVLRTQHNIWLHTAISVAVLLVGLWLRLARYDWVIIIITMALVWSAEFFNTAIEAVVDLVTEEQHPLAKISKDVAAAAVLITALAAVLVGLLILGPPLSVKLNTLF